MLANFFGGLLFCGVGVALSFYSMAIVRIFGRVSWAELHLGGTRNLLILLGFFVIVVGVSMMFGMFTVTNPADQLSTGFVM